MFLALGAFILLLMVFGPSLWIKFVMRRYSEDKPEMPGTGGELAEHLIDRFTMIPLRKKSGYFASITKQSR